MTSSTRNKNSCTQFVAPCHSCFALESLRHLFWKYLCITSVCIRKKFFSFNIAQLLFQIFVLFLYNFSCMCFFSLQVRAGGCCFLEGLVNVKNEDDEVTQTSIYDLKKSDSVEFAEGEYDRVVCVVVSNVPYVPRNCKFFLNFF